MRLEITEPDDWHLHLRDGRAMADVVGHSGRSFARAVIMPNALRKCWREPMSESSGLL